MVLISLWFFLCRALTVHPPAPGDDPLIRSYREGEKWGYLMRGVNENWHYEICADGVVKKDANGIFFEEYGWSHLVSDHWEVERSPQVTISSSRCRATPRAIQEVSPI